MSDYRAHLFAAGPGRHYPKENMGWQHIVGPDKLRVLSWRSIQQNDGLLDSYHSPFKRVRQCYQTTL